MHNYRNLPLRVGGISNLRQQEYGLECLGIRRNTALGRSSNNCRLQTRSLVGDGTIHQQTCICLKMIKRKEIGLGSQMGS
jgi:hypothetical protein